jgi:hypothetical protein
MSKCRGNGGRSCPSSQTVRADFIVRLDNFSGRVLHLGSMAPSRDDTRILIFATLLVVGAGVLVAVVLLLATGRGGSPSKYEPFQAGAAKDIKRLLKDGGPYYVADPFGGNRSILFALEDGQVVALSTVVPNTKDCHVRVKNEGKSFVDCHGDKLQSTELDRYLTTVRHLKDANDILLVDLRTKEPAPAG